ncbi:MAG: hypothetical protein ACTHKU_10370 [Verrucomicrobiota bacterium]
MAKTTADLVDAISFRAQGLTNKTLRCSYNYCGICGHVPGQYDEPNYAPLRWWDCDDGWKIGTLCHWCHDEVFHAKPKEGDFAFRLTNEVADVVETDEDSTLAL